MPFELKWILLCLALVAGEVLGFSALPLAFAWPVAAWLAVLVSLAGYGLPVRHWPFVSVFAAGFALALRSADMRIGVLGELESLNGGSTAYATFVVGDDVAVVERNDGSRRATFAGVLRGIPVRVVIELSDGVERPRTGETWALSGWLGRGESPFGCKRRTFWAGGRGSTARRIEARTAGTLARIRADFSKRVGFGLDESPDIADLNRAMLLGERFRIPPDVRKSFVNAGTIHVFAISGLHVLFIAKIFAVLLACAFVPSRWAGLVLTPLLWTYVALVGSGPSAVRAATMATVYYLAPVFWRKSNGFVAWAVAFMITYVRAPEMVFDVGCTFSFAVMFAIIAWLWWIKNFDVGVAKPLCISAVAWLAGVPIAAHVFGRITPGGLVANLFSVPVAEVGVTTGALGLMASYASETLARHLNNLSALATGFLMELSRLVSVQGWASRNVRPWTLAECVAWYAAIAVAMLAARSVAIRRKRRV